MRPRFTAPRVPDRGAFAFPMILAYLRQVFGMPA
jgi:hypothetical protein